MLLLICICMLFIDHRDTRLLFHVNEVLVRWFLGLLTVEMNSAQGHNAVSVVVSVNAMVHEIVSRDRFAFATP